MFSKTTILVGLLFGTCILAYKGLTAQANPNLNNEVSATALIDYLGFQALTLEVAPYREERLVDLATFREMAKDPGTIILDTRSAEAFNSVHWKGAVHLNFSDFTAEKLAKLIPNPDTRILIYCNNNIESPLSSLTDKSFSLALNIPTFMNLYGYGYKNVYELNSRVTHIDLAEDLEGDDFNPENYSPARE